MVVNPPPRIVCAAIKFKCGTIVCGARHFDLVMHAVIDKISKLDKSDHIQGFLDAKGIFCDRQTAWRIAKTNNQITNRLPPHNGTLYSEDLY